MFCTSSFKMGMNHLMCTADQRAQLLSACIMCSMWECICPLSPKPLCICVCVFVNGPWLTCQGPSVCLLPALHIFRVKMWKCLKLSPPLCIYMCVWVMGLAQYGLNRHRRLAKADNWTTVKRQGTVASDWEQFQIYILVLPINNK